MIARSLVGPPGGRNRTHFACARACLCGLQDVCRSRLPLAQFPARQHLCRLQLCPNVLGLKCYLVSPICARMCVCAKRGGPTDQRGEPCRGVSRPASRRPPPKWGPTDPFPQLCLRTRCTIIRCGKAPPQSNVFDDECLDHSTHRSVKAWHHPPGVHVSMCSRIRSLRSG